MEIITDSFSVCNGRTPFDFEHDVSWKSLGGEE